MQMCEWEVTLASTVESIQIVVKNPVEHVKDEHQCEKLEYGLKHEQDDKALLHRDFKDDEEQVDDSEDLTSAAVNC